MQIGVNFLQFPWSSTRVSISASSRQVPGLIPTIFTVIISEVVGYFNRVVNRKFTINSMKISWI